MMLRGFALAAIVVCLPLTARASTPGPEEVQQANAMLAEGLAGDPSFTPSFDSSFYGPALRAALDPGGLDSLTWNASSPLDNCSVSQGLLGAYLFKGVPAESRGLAIASRSSPYAAIVSRNVGLYHDELAAALAFLVSCTARAIPMAQAFWNDLPEPDRSDVRREGALKLRNDFAQMITGAVITVSEPSYTDANKLLVLDAMVANAASFGSILPSPRRQAIIAAIDKTLASASPARREKLVLFKQRLVDAPCTGICQL